MTDEKVYAGCVKFEYRLDMGAALALMGNLTKIEMQMQKPDKTTEKTVTAQRYDDTHIYIITEATTFDVEGTWKIYGYVEDDTGRKLRSETVTEKVYGEYK